MPDSPILEHPAVPWGSLDDAYYDLTRFTLADMVRCGRDLRRLSNPGQSLEEIAGAIVGYFYDHLRNGQASDRACVLVRFFKTHAFGQLTPELARFAQALMPAAPLRPETKCLTLMATRGDEPAWNSRRDSKRHQAIPLPSEAVLDEVPMISQLLRQLGVKLSDLIVTRPEIIKDLDQRTFNVFHVFNVRQSPFVPAQHDFVEPHGVQSALGFGGILPDGNLFALILFSRVTIPSETAAMFRTIALNVKMALLAVPQDHVFAR